MEIKRNWNEFRENFPELVDGVKSLGAVVYSYGAEDGCTSTEFESLCELLADAPAEAVNLLGLNYPINRIEVLRTVFILGAEMLFNLEEGKVC